MNRAGLTALYLDELKRRGIAARELIGTESVLLDSCPRSRARSG
jgi:hypothetical protein